MATAIFFATSTGNTEEIANKISEKLNNLEVFDLNSTDIDNMNNYDKLIIGCSTWGDGELNDDWEDSWEDFCNLDFSGKTVALFGLGDQESYSDEFCNALGTIYNQINTTGANIIGFTSTKGYTHDESTAQIGDEFVGLVIDEDNEEDLTEERINKWVEKIKNDII